MSRARRWLRSPLGFCLIASAAIYAGFLLWPQGSWMWSLGGAIDWVGGAILLVAPIVVASACELTIAARHDVESRIPATERQPWGALAIIGTTFGVAATLHLMAVVIAALLAADRGARDLALTPFIGRQLAALLACAAFGYAFGLVVRWRFASPLAAVLTFAGWSVLVATGRGFLVLAGGLPLVSAWHRVNWFPVASQIVLWLLLATAAFFLDLRTRSLSKVGTAIAGAAGLALFAALPLIGDTNFSPTYTAASGQVACAGAEGERVCLAAGSEAWRPLVSDAASATYAALQGIGVSTPTHVVDVGGSLSTAYEHVPGDLASGHGVTLSYEPPEHGQVPLMLINELVVDPRCPEEAAYVPDQALAWLYAKLGNDIEPDLVAEVNASGDGAAWLREVFNMALACDTSGYPELPR